MKKRIVSAILILSMLASISLLSGCGQAVLPAQAGRTIVDMAGREVIVPEDPQSICVLDAFAAPIAVMMGCGEKMPTTINAVRRNHLLQDICPALKDAVVVKSSDSINAETILERETELLIVSKETYDDPDQRAKLDAIGIPCLVIGYETMQEQMDVVSLLGAALRAEETAEAYNAYYRECIGRVSDASAQVPAEQLQRLYHSVNEAARTDYVGSLCADWISLTRVINVSLDTELSFEDEKAFATLEQIYLWDPDLIICNESGVADYILRDGKWEGLRAVLDGRVYQIPIGVSRWGHPTSVETPLAILWLGELLYPDRLEIEIRTETIKFFRDFFGYALSAEETEAILSGYGTRTPRINTTD